MVNINPRFDNKTGQYIILWNDVLMAFKNPLHVRNGDTAVPFVTDENFEFIQPLRVFACPGVILDIVVEHPAIETGEVLRMMNSPGYTSLSPTFMNYPYSPVSEGKTCITPPLPLSPTSTTSPMSPMSPTSQTSSTSTDSIRAQRPKAGPQYYGEGSDATPEAFWIDSPERAPQWITDSNYSGGSIDDNNTQSTNECYSDDRYVGDVENVLDQAERDIIANYDHGVAYYEGKDIPQNYIIAFEWFLRAASQGHTDAQDKLGCMYSNGKGIPRDYSKAVEWYQLAANQGYAKSLCNLGFLYEGGIGVTRDDSKAVELYGRAAKQGYATAQCNIGYMYENGNGLGKDYTRAMDWYLKAADQGHARAQCNIGFMYERGSGVTKDYGEAVEWYQKSADQGYSSAQCNLGFMYENGKGTRTDYSKAVEWYEKAAKQGHSRAQFNLGSMYKNGQGVTKDLAKAMEWWSKAAKQGHTKAQRQLAKYSNSCPARYIDPTGAASNIPGNVTETTIPLSKTVNITPRYDSKTGQYIILWNDVLMAFKDASHVQYGDMAIPFHTDENFEFLKPLRISAHPGIVLDAVHETKGNEATLESLRIQESKETTTKPSSPSSPTMLKSPQSIPVTENNMTTGNDDQTENIKAAPQYRGDAVSDTVSSSPPAPLRRGPQLILEEHLDNSSSLYNHTQPIVEQISGNIPPEKVQDIQEPKIKNADTCYEQGLAYYNGTNAPKDYSLAMEWFLMAAEQGDTEA
ncbi:hypothetical protein BGX26_012499 [Mortierella sp. AD094]|nr:hypothetical protein BGX26_012499 [Mortierella sp. AD094]